MNWNKKQQAVFKREALAIAREANEENFHSRRGIGHLETAPGEYVLYFYDNNPWEGDPMDGGLRGEEVAGLRAWMKREGIAELAFASYPLKGEGAGYTTAMIIDAPPAREAEIREVKQKLSAITFRKLDERAAAKEKAGKFLQVVQ